MYFRHSILLLQISVAAIIFLLSMMTGYRLSDVAKMGNSTPAAYCEVSSAVINDSLYQMGKELWNANACGACHNRNMKDDATAPALAGVEERWAEYPRQDLYGIIRNNSQMVAEEHPLAVQLRWDWKSAMNNYPNLKDKEIEALLVYIKGQED